MLGQLPTYIIIALVAVFIASFFNNGAARIVDKLLKAGYGTVHVVASSDTRFAATPDPAKVVPIPGDKTVRLYFIRHGESEWNLIFNKGKILLLPRLLLALIRELFESLRGDSIFFDSPLNEEGMDQAKALLRELDGRKNDPDVSTLLGLSGSSVVVVSNLRRAIATAVIGLWGRLQRTREKVIIQSLCQEISRNVDTLALAEAHEIPALPGMCEALDIPESSLGQLFDTRQNFGNKALRGSGLNRLVAFCDYAFKREEESVIVGGHSLWFRHFFRTFLPKSSNHDAKRFKIVNSGIIALDLQRGRLPNGQTWFYVDPQSIRAVSGGFKK